MTTAKRDLRGPGRPDVGKKVEVRLTDEQLGTVDHIARRRGRSLRDRAAVLRELVERGLGCPAPGRGRDLITEHLGAAVLTRTLVDDGAPYGIDVYGDGTNLWVVDHEDGNVLAHTDRPRFAALVQAFALLEFADRPGGTRLAAAGRAILDDLDAQERDLRHGNRDLLPPREPNAVRR
ncbi:hypothetical protein ACFC58_07085 [Kitasatospora purpeofusca]|uniref:hypothetical protein n=1 Tax=Kitasatospora purpeofusca TaxID=67352 RepID=UPI0035DCAA77